MTTAAIYTRVSDDHGKEGMSVAEQERLLRNLAASQQLEVVATFTDDDIGASEFTPSNKIREGYIQMLAAAKAGEFRFILAYSASRLTRRPTELQDLVVLANPPFGVRVITSVSGNDDLTTADGLMTARLKSVIDAAESHRISERTRAKNQQRASEGKVGHSPWRAFGFEDDGVTHRPDEAALIREAVELIKGGAALREIGRLWEQRGVKGTPAWRKGLEKGETEQRTQWNHSDVKDVVFKWKNVGVRTYKGEVMKGVDEKPIPVVWEPIYSIEDREAALAQIETNYTKPHLRATKGVLSGLLICGRCRRNLYSNAGSGRANPFYICTDGRKAHLGITAPALEEYVQDVVFRYIMERNYFGAVESDKTVAPWPGEQRLAVIATKMQEMTDAYAENMLPGALYYSQIAKFRIEQQELAVERKAYYAMHKPRERIFKNVNEAIQFYLKWSEQPIERRRAALRDELDGIVISPGEQGKRGHAALVKRVKLGWKEPHPIFNGRSAEEAYREPLMAFATREHAKEDGRPTPPPRSDREAYEKWLEDEYEFWKAQGNLKFGSPS